VFQEEGLIHLIFHPPITQGKYGLVIVAVVFFLTTMQQIIAFVNYT